MPKPGAILTTSAFCSTVKTLFSPFPWLSPVSSFGRRWRNTAHPSHSTGYESLDPWGSRWLAPVVNKRCTVQLRRRRVGFCWRVSTETGKVQHGHERRFVRELNHAYTVMLASKFQLFCRDLHSEAVERLTDAATPTSMRPIFRESLLDNRQLDSKNAQPGSLGSDFNRLGFELNAWRNAIAHQTFTRARPLAPAPPLQLRHVRTWRTACNALARSMDAVVGDHIRAMVGAAPW